MRKFSECTEKTGLRRFVCFALIGLCLLLSPAGAQQTSADAEIPMASIPIVPPFEETEQRPPPCTSEACRRLQVQIQRGCRKGNDVPYADTIFLRRGVDLPLSLEERRSLSLARLAQDPQVAETLLEPLLQSDLPDVRYAAALHLMLAVQSTQDNLAHTAVARSMKLMAAEAENISYPASDYLVLAAALEESKGNEREAIALLELAVDVDRRSYPALLALLTLHMEKARRNQTQGRTICRNAFNDVFSTLGQLLDLEPCRSQAAHTGVLLAREVSRPDQDAPYLAALAYLSTLSRRPDATIAVLENLATVPRLQCRGFLINQIRDFAGAAGQ